MESPRDGHDLRNAFPDPHSDPNLSHPDSFLHELEEYRDSDGEVEMSEKLLDLEDDALQQKNESATSRGHTRGVSAQIEVEQAQARVRAPSIVGGSAVVQQHPQDVERSTPPVPEPTWANLPNKGQLAILSLSRFADFFQIACLQAIMFHQLQSFDPEASDATISWQAGILQGGFTAAQIVSAIVWGRMADKPWMGRKNVLLVGFVGTGFACLGVAFSRSFGQAVIFRIIGGAVNGTIGAARTMVAESVPKRYHSRAFVTLPLAFNMANILGPIFGGLLAEPVASLPSFFGPNSVFGGAEGVAWMKDFPFAAPNLLSAFVMFAEATLIYFGLFETLAARKGLPDSGREFAGKVKGLIFEGKWRGGVNKSQYQQLGGVQQTTQIELISTDSKAAAPAFQKPTLPFWRIWRPNVILTMLSVGLFQFHMGAFSSLWLIFLSTKREDNNLPQPHRLPFAFSGGLSFSPQTVGLAMSILGFIGVILQMFLYPRVTARLGLLRSFRYALVLFPLAYFLAPYLALIPSSSATGQATGFALWFGIAIVLGLEVCAQTFAIPASIILMNNSSPHPSVLGTINGLGQCSAAVSKTMGTMLAGKWYAIGLHIGVVGTAWWAVACVSVLGCFAAYFIYNGSGHEIKLPGDKEEDL